MLAILGVHHILHVGRIRVNVPIVLKYGNLNLMETSGLVQACKRISLPV